MDELYSILIDSINRNIFKKAVFSLFTQGNIEKCVAKPVVIKDSVIIQFESFLNDGKALHKNVSIDDLEEYFIGNFSTCKRINILTGAGECIYMVSKKGKVSIVNHIKKSGGEIFNATAHDSEKNYIIKEHEKYDFLYYLGIQDENGEIIDSMRHKFKQINKFLENIEDIGKTFTDEKLYVLDLCCGKSYLSFALYYYLFRVLSKSVEMVCVDLKEDVINYCADIAKKCGFENMKFICGDVNKFVPDKTPDMVVSLHACDIATDMVLGIAIKYNAKYIVSSPCCHHEMSKQIDKENEDLNFILSLPFLKQKFCDVATDALRIKGLEACGYKCKAIEFIDPTETPKNLMIKAYKKYYSVNEKEQSEYNKICEYLGIDPYLKKYINK